MLGKSKRIREIYISNAVEALLLLSVQPMSSSSSSYLSQLSYGGNGGNGGEPPHRHVSFNDVSSSSLGHVLRDDLDALSNMERENLNLKMKLFYLEHGATTKTIITSPQHPHQNHHREDIEGPSVQTIHDFARRLEEKNLEVDQRNQLLARAKSAIEALKAELERSRLENKHRIEGLETQLRQVKLLNDEITYKYHEKVLDLEEKLEQKDKELLDKEKLRSQNQQTLEMFRDKFAEQARKEKELEGKLDDSRIQSQQVRIGLTC